MTNLHEAATEAMRAFVESNRRAEDAVRKATREAQAATEQVQALAAQAAQLQRTWATVAIVGKMQLPRLVPEINFPEVARAS